MNEMLQCGISLNRRTSDYLKPHELSDPVSQPLTASGKSWDLQPELLQGERVSQNMGNIDNFMISLSWHSSYGEINNKSRPFTDFGVCSDHPAMPLDNRVTYRKAEP